MGQGPFSLTPSGDLPFDLTGGSFGAALDYPGVLLDNALRGRIFSAGLTPSEMSPQDRASIADRLKAQLPDLPIVGAVAEIALNPWVWLGFALSAPFKLPDVGKVWEPALRYLPTVRKEGSLLQFLGPTTARQELVGSDLLRILTRVERDSREFTRVAEPSLLLREQVLARNGLRRLSQDPELAAAIQAKLHGLDRQRTVTRFRMEKGRTPQIVEREVVPILRQDRLDAFLRERGADGYVRSLQDTYERMYLKLFADDAGAVDPNKVQRIVRGMLKDIDGQQISTLRGSPIEHLFDRDMMQALMEGRISKKQFERFVALSVQKKDFYAPLNHNRMYLREPSGAKKIENSELSNAMDRYRTNKLVMRRFGTMLERQPLDNVFDPDDIENLRRFGNENYSKAVAQSYRLRDIRAAKAQEGAVFGMPSLDADRALDRYIRQSARNYSMHVVQPDEFIVAGQREARAKILEARNKGLIDKLPSTFYDPDLPGVVDQTRRSVMGVAEGAGPAGGFSMYDILRAGYSTISDTGARKHVRDVFLPVVLGERSIRAGAFTSIALRTKEFTRGLLETDALKQMKGTDKGEKLYDAMLGWAKEGIDDAQAIDRGIARYLYGTTLGANPATIALNLGQPLITLPRFMPAESIIAGYAGAFKDLAKYVSLRTQHFRAHGPSRRGFLIGPENQRDKLEIVRRSFEYADAAEIGPQIDELIDAVRSPILKDSRSGPLGKIDDTIEFMLKGFEKGEWFNRSVTAHAVAHRAKTQGRTLVGDELDEAIRTVSEQTQFGASALNTPRAFLDTESQVAFLTNPVFRQFLTFTTRMATGLVEGRRIGGGGIREALDQRSIMPALLSFRDLGRSMAISAIMYEAGKELLGVDLTPATVVGGAAGLYRPEGLLAPLPAPPAVTLPLSVVQALTTGDAEVLRYTLPTLVPGGVAIFRSLSAAPDIPGLGVVQRASVDYTSPITDEEGRTRYPVYNPEGRLVSYETRGAISARAAGLDFGRFRNESEALRYLSRLRKQAIDWRRRYMEALARGEAGKAQEIADEFRNRFGYELTINESQMRAYQESKTISRLERSMENLPRGLRERVTPAVAAELGSRLGLPPEQFTSGLTITQRRPAASFPPVPDSRFVGPSPRTIEEWSQNPNALGSDSGFAPFGSF